jgi:hypothetical protein
MLDDSLPDHAQFGFFKLIDYRLGLQGKQAGKQEGKRN